MRDYDYANQNADAARAVNAVPSVSRRVLVGYFSFSDRVSIFSFSFLFREATSRDYQLSESRLGQPRRSDHPGDSGRA
ncbi:hypothetical protein GCM10027056_27960 [Glaciibacter psychrotolerans]